MTTKIGAYLTDDTTTAAAFVGAAIVLAFMVWRTGRLLVADWACELGCRKTWGAVLVGAGDAAPIDDRTLGAQLYAPAHADVWLRAALRAHRREVPRRAIEPVGDIENRCDGCPRPEQAGRMSAGLAVVPIDRLIAPDRVETCSSGGERGPVPVEVYQRERKHLTEARRRSRAKLETAAAGVKGKIARLLTLVENGHVDPVATGPRINELVTERKRIAEALKHEPDSNVIEFFPKAAERYRRQVADIHAALSRGEAGDREAIALVRALIARIVVHATTAPDPVGLEVEGSLSILLSEAPDMAYSAIGCCRPPQPVL